MMTLVVWSRKARAHLRSVMDFETTRDPVAAAELARCILHRVAMLGEFPRIGPPSQRGTRKLVVTGTPYILIYRETLDRVAIVGLWHHALRKRSK